MFALYLLLSFLAPSHSAITRSLYIKPQCTGEVVGGNTLPENICLYGRKVMCNATHVYSIRYSHSDCTGPESVLEEPLPLHTCINNTQFSCDGSNDFPENALYEARWPDSNCQGQPTFEWSKLNTCVPDPDGHGRSAFLTYEPNKKPRATYYRTHDCTGESQEGPLSNGGGDTILYNTQEQQISNMPYVYEYTDQNCAGEPYHGATYQPNTYPFEDLPTGQCINGKKSFSAGTFTIPAKSQLRSEFDGSGPCKVVISHSFTRMEVCKPQEWQTGSEMLTFNDTTQEFYYNSYQTTDCTGEATRDRVEHTWTNYGGINVKPTNAS